MVRYGGLLINVPRLMNEMIVEAHKEGKVVYGDCGDKSLIDLSTKCFNSEKRYSSRAVQILINLNMFVRHTKTHIVRKIKTDRWHCLSHNSGRFDETIDSFDWCTSCR